MKAIILAAGNSSRYGTNKLLAAFNGKTLPEYNIDFCIENKITDIYVSISRNHVEFKDEYVNNVQYITHPIKSNILTHLYCNYSHQGAWGEDVIDVNVKFKFQSNNNYGPAAGLLPWIDDISEDDEVLILFGDNYLKGTFDKSLLKQYDAIATYKELQEDPTNTRFAAIQNNTLIEKPHSFTSGTFFIGFMYMTGKGFNSPMRFSL